MIRKESLIGTRAACRSVKRILLAGVAMGLLSLLLATPEPQQKVDWCHYPPGQWTGNPDTSNVVILNIDVAAEEGHLGHSPSLAPGVPAEGLYQRGQCPSLPCLTREELGPTGSVVPIPCILR
jgi:hypothetical protein